jgi:diketogulonate reductase-like aldo/keto reductase
MGTWRLGSIGDRPIESLRHGFDLGLTLVDTAESYGYGYAEKLVGEAIKGYSRDDLFIISKVASNRRREEILEAAKRSVENLGTYMDLYLLHSPYIVYGSLEERMLGLEDAVDEGYARAIGVSNFPLPLIEKARNSLRKHDIVAVQNKLNLFDRYWLPDVVPYCEREGLMYIAYSPLDTGRVGQDDGLLQTLSQKYGKTRLQVSLNWLKCLPSVVPIPKCGKLRHIDECAGSLDWKLSESDWGKLLEEYATVDGFYIFNRFIVKDNLRYYLAPRLFSIYARYYYNPDHILYYAGATSWKRRHHI